MHLTVRRVRRASWKMAAVGDSVCFDVVAVLPAGGSGVRMNIQQPKQVQKKGTLKKLLSLSQISNHRDMLPRSRTLIIYNQHQRIWLCPREPVHKGITTVFSLFRSLWLAVVYYLVFCMGSCVPVHEDRTGNFPNATKKVE